MGYKLTAILFTSTIALFLISNCDTTEPPLIESIDTLSLIVEKTSHTSIMLHLVSTAHNKNALLVLERTQAGNNVEIMFSESLTTLDTLIVDNNNGLGLKLDTEYKYQAIIKRTNDDEIINSGNIVTTRTKSAVSQEFSWQEYSYGEWQSGFSDIWGLDENNVYMTGFIKTDSISYYLVKWNGSELEFLNEGGGIGIFGFAKDDIWTVTNSVRHFDGSTWERIDGYTKDNQSFPRDTILFNNRVYHALWGTNSNNLYLVGQSDNIVYWDGNKASELFGTTNINLTEIHGYDKNFIITTGTAGVPPSIALKYIGKKWEVIEGLDYNYQFYGCYVVSPKEYYIAGAKIFRYYNEKWEEVVGDSLGMKIDIKGDKSTGEIVAVGRVNTVLHWNGVQWINIGKDISSETNNLQSVYIVNNKIFAVGTNGVAAKLFIGTRK